MPSEVKAQDTTSLASIKTVNEAATQSRALLAQMEQAAEDAGTTLDGIYQDAKDAQTAADSAKQSADTAYTNLSQIQSVLEVAQWIATHGTYEKATVFNPNATYYTITATQVTKPSDDDKDSQGVLIYYELDNGIYVRTTDTSVQTGKTYYRVTGTPVAQPDAEHIADYYILAVSEAMADYVQSHLALTNDGLYVMADDSEWKVQITDNGVYILDPNNNPVNQMTADGSIVGYKDETHVEIKARSFALYKQRDASPYLNFEYLIDSDGYITERAQIAGTNQAFISYDTNTDSIESVKVNGVETPFTLSRGYGTELFFWDIQLDSSDIIVVKYIPVRTGAKDEAIAFTFGTRGVSNSGALSFAVGNGNRVEAFHGVAIGDYNFINPNGVNSKAIGYNLKTVGRDQLVVGKYNKPQLDTAFEIGNGTGTNNRSNSFTVDWDGKVECGNYQGKLTALLDLTHPKGSTYGTVLPPTINGHSYDDGNLTDADKDACGDTWFDPRIMWGGTWEKLPEGYILLSGSESGSYQVGTDSTSSGYKEYGANTKNIQTSNLPAHSHTIGSNDRYFLAMNKSPDRAITRTNVASGSAKTVYAGENGIVRTSATDSTGSGSAFNVMQKSIAVYIWIRTA